MNVLILTPDAVGSTLLQRLITIYMQFHNYDKPVINLHELTNGLTKYYNQNFNQEVLGKPQDKPWGYYQTLNDIINLLDSTDHYKTSRLAHYHIRNRQDSMDQQIPFYQYLNENFYIISCRRHNVFEHALSWCLTKVTKKLNVYTSEEKISSFFELYKNGIDLDPNSLLQTLNAYKDYVNWCNNHFSVASYFYYDEHLSRIESYILSLPIFAQTNRLTWKDNFDIDFNSWNQCHRTSSDMGTLLLKSPDKFAQISYNPTEFEIEQQQAVFLENYRQVADPSWPKIQSMAEYQQLPEHIQQEVKNQHKLVEVNGRYEVSVTQSIFNLLPDTQKDFFNKNKATYQTALTKIQHMVNSGILVNAPPIKKQTLAEKKHIIRNYHQLLDVYNRWIEKNPEIGNPIDSEILDNFAQAELNHWDPANLKNQLTVGKNVD